MNDTAVKNTNAPRWPQQGEQRRATFTPQVDILETADEMRLVLDLPGVKAEDVDIHFERGELTVHAKVAPRTAPGKPVFAEYQVGDYYRAFIVGQEVDGEAISADLKSGVLTVHLPRAASAKPRRIEVKK
jgi:HSP20 family protein